MVLADRGGPRGLGSPGSPGVVALAQSTAATLTASGPRVGLPAHLWRERNGRSLLCGCRGRLAKQSLGLPSWASTADPCIRGHRRPLAGSACLGVVGKPIGSGLSHWHLWPGSSRRPVIDASLSSQGKRHLRLRPGQPPEERKHSGRHGELRLRRGRQESEQDRGGHPDELPLRREREPAGAP